VASSASSGKSRGLEIPCRSSSSGRRDPVADENIILVCKKRRNHVREGCWVKVGRLVQRKIEGRRRRSPEIVFPMAELAALRALFSAAWRRILARVSGG
jgi:hypothetical protein